MKSKMIDRMGSLADARRQHTRLSRRGMGGFAARS